MLRNTLFYLVLPGSKDLEMTSQSQIVLGINAIATFPRQIQADHENIFSWKQEKENGLHVTI